MIRKLAFLVLKEVRVLCSLMDLTDKVLETLCFITSQDYFLVSWIMVFPVIETLDKL